MKKVIWVFVAIVGIGVLTYALGPKPGRLNLNPDAGALIDPTVFDASYVQQVVDRSQGQRTIKKGNSSQLYWADSAGRKTEFVLLYLHGFSACPEEGQPVAGDFARRYGMNMYAPLLAEHGLVEDEPMLHFTAEKYIESAKQALRLARLMGDSVIIMSTSTGSTAALYLASGQNAIHSLICYSPNVKIFDPKSSLLTRPWGLEIARLVKGNNYHQWVGVAGADQFWHLKYRLESLIELQRLVETTMTKATFEKIKAPTFVGYYYKNEAEQDAVVSVPAALDMYEALGSSRKRKVAFPNVGVHALANGYFSKDIQSVKRETNAFAEEVLLLSPAP